VKKVEFIFIELCVFLSQAVVIFLVTFFISDMLKNEDMLTDFVSSKLNATTLSELGLTIFAVTFVLGLLYIVKEMTMSGLAERVASEVINELPRTIYLFGSSISAVTTAVAIFLWKHPESLAEVEEKSSLDPVSFFGLSLFIGASFFVYGLLIKFGLRRKSQKLKDSEKSADDVDKGVASSRQ